MENLKFNMPVYSILIIFITAFLMTGCSKKDDKPVTEQKLQQPQTNDKEEIENPEDTTLTLQEQFSTSIMTDFLDDSDDEDLQDYLETEIYKYSQNYNGVSLIELSPSTWFVSFEKDGNNKNFILQKYIDFKTSDVYFRIKESNLTITEIVSKNKSKPPGGD